VPKSADCFGPPVGSQLVFRALWFTASICYAAYFEIIQKIETSQISLKQKAR